MVKQTALFSSSGPIGEQVFRFIRGVVRIVLFRWFRVQIEGRERLALEGPFIIAPAHRSHLDGPLIGGLTHRRVRYLGKESLFRPAPLGWVMEAIGVFPVRRGTADFEAMKAARKLLNEGNAMLVFPEGTRQPVGEIRKIFDGAAWLAAKAVVPVVPAGIAGTGEALPSGAKFPRREKVVIVVGEMMDPPTAADGSAAKRVDMTAWSAQLRVALEQCQQRARMLADNR